MRFKKFVWRTHVVPMIFTTLQGPDKIQFINRQTAKRRG